MSKPSNLRIEDVAASTARADLNDILISIASLQTTDGAGAAYTGEPTSTYPNMLWYDKATNILKIRTTADDAWINVAYVDQTANAYRILNDTQVVNTSGSQTGLLGDQSTSTWESGAGTTESLVSPAKVKAAIIANSTGFGDGQTWQNKTSSRSTGTTYTNTTGKAIAINIETTYVGGGRVGITATIDGYSFEFANAIFPSGGSLNTTGTTIVPNGSTYRISITGGVSLNKWSEMR